MIEITAFVRTTEKHGLSPVNYYRALLPMATLGKTSSKFNVRILTQDDTKSIIQLGLSGTLLGQDIYLISRLYREEGQQEFLDTIHDHGGLVVFDTDDDLTCDYRELGRGDDFKAMIRTADLVTVSTPYLSKQLEKYTGYRPPVLYNHVDVEWFSKVSLATEKKVPGLTIGFIGTASHEADWIFPVKALVAIAEEHPGVTIVAAGYLPEYLRELPSVAKLKPVPYPRYPGLMRQFDIVCCSLDPGDVFNRSKSSLKALEAMSAARTLSNGKTGGAIPVCTDMPVYRRAVNKHNGVLTSNDDWYEALSRLVNDEQLRNRLATQGYRWVRKNRDITTGYKAWARTYRNLLGGKYDDIPRATRRNQDRERHHRSGRIAV